MPFHDLNVVYDSNHVELSQTLAFLHELGYTTAALAVSVLSKVPAQLPLVQKEQLKRPAGLNILTRLTLTVSDTSQNHRISSLVSTHDLLALRPTTEKAFQLCCGQLDCDIISLDFTTRIPYPLKFKTVASALQRGVRFEISYAGGITGSNDARRNLISGAASLIRATRGRGIILSSEARTALGIRAPHDVINLASIWGLSNERAKEAVCEEVDKVVTLAGIKRSSFRGVVDVIDDGSRVVTLDAVSEDAGRPPSVNPEAAIPPPLAGANSTSSLPPLKHITVIPEKKDNAKRKASEISLVGASNQHKKDSDKPLSKRELKRQSKKARVERAIGTDI